MSAVAWIADFYFNPRVGVDVGTRYRYAGHEWTAATHEVDRHRPLGIADAMRRQLDGYKVDPAFFPEVAIWDRKSFSKTADIFYASCFLAVKGKLADVLAKFDLGKGGLVPFTLLQEDLVTPEPGKYFYLNFDEPKDSLRGSESRNVKFEYFAPKKGTEVWAIRSGAKDDDVVLSLSALSGPDIWAEKKISSRVFLSDALTKAILAVGAGHDLNLMRCRIEGAQ